MTQKSNFFTSLTDNINMQISDKSDRKKANKEINESLNKLFKRCSDSVDTYDLYEKMFDILNHYDKRQFKKTKIKEGEFTSILEGKRKNNDDFIRSILKLAGIDGDAKDVSGYEINKEYERYNTKNKLVGNSKGQKNNTSKKNSKKVGQGYEGLDLIEKIKRKKKRLSDEGVNCLIIDAAIKNGYSVKETIKFNELWIRNSIIVEAMNQGYRVKDIKKYVEAGMGEKTLIDALEGNREFNLGDIPNIDKNYDLVNELYHGKRIDKSLENWTIDVGGKQVQIKTDNNLYTEEYAKKHGVPKNGNPLPDSKIKAIGDALERMAAFGQDIPDEIYLTDVFETGIAGYCYAKFPNTIYVSPNSSKEYLKEVIYHESAHMKDFALGKTENKNEALSYKKEPNLINKEKSSIDFSIKGKNYSIPTSSIEKLISGYSLTNNLEFVAEITAMITSGKIRQKIDGTYKIRTKADGTYKNAKWVTVKFEPKDAQILNDIMALYNYLTDGKIVTPMKNYSLGAIVDNIISAFNE